MGPIAIICATPEEYEALGAHVDAPHAMEMAGFRAREGRYDERQVIVAQAGIGKVNSATLTTLLLARHACQAVIFSGVAGALAPDLPVGSVLLAERVATHDYGIVTSGTFTRVEPGTIPIGAPKLSEAARLEADIVAKLERLRDLVRPTLGHPVRLGTLLSGDVFLNCAATRDSLWRELGGDAVDMESDAVVQVARRFGVPTYIIRTMSDRAGEDSHVSYNEMAEMASHNSAMCVRDLLTMM